MYSRLIVDRGAIRRNYRYIKSLASHVIAVVKSNAYGLGIDTVIPALIAEGCTSFAVAYLDEGIALRRLVNEEIFVFNAPSHDQAAFEEHNLTPVLNTVHDALLWKGKQAAIHVDTGMNRHGIPWHKYIQAQEELKSIPWALVMSHLSSSDMNGHPSHFRQLALVNTLKSNHPHSKISLSNSGGICLGKDYAFDVVRPGMALYGMNPAPHLDHPFEFCVHAEAEVLQTFSLQMGESVGYQETFTAPYPMRVATLAMGYADGIPWRAGLGKSSVLFDGVKSRILGRVSMDLTTVDITHLPSIKRGDFATVFSKERSFNVWADECQTSCYEMSLHLGRRLHRFVQDSTSINLQKHQDDPSRSFRNSFENIEKVS